MLRACETQTTRLDVPEDVTLCWLCDANVSLYQSVSIFRVNINLYHADGSSMEMDVLHACETQTTRLDVPEDVPLCRLCDANVSLYHSVSIFRVNIKLYHADGSSMIMDVSGCTIWFLLARSSLLLANI
jgi:hypothetical protein